MTLSENIWNNRIGGFVLYAKSTVDGSIVAVKVNPVTGALQVDTEVTVALDPTGLAIGAKQDTGNASLTSIDGKLPALVGGKFPVDATVTATIGDVSVLNYAVFDFANTANGGLKFRARREGLPGQAISVSCVVGSGNNSLSVTVSDNDIVIHSATTAGVATSTATDVLNAIVASSAASLLIVPSLMGSDTGAGIFGYMPHSHLQLPSRQIINYAKVILHGTESDGTITPVLVDSSGNLSFASP